MVSCPAQPNGIVLFLYADTFTIFKMLLPVALMGIDKITDGRTKLEMPSLLQTKLKPWDSIILLNQKALA
jgi:hypothetical protein